MWNRFRKVGPEEVSGIGSRIGIDSGIGFISGTDFEIGVGSGIKFDFGICMRIVVWVLCSYNSIDSHQEPKFTRKRSMSLEIPGLISFLKFLTSILELLLISEPILIPTPELFTIFEPIPIPEPILTPRPITESESTQELTPESA